MRLLPDTHLLLWLSESPEKLSHEARLLMEDPENEIFFSAVSIWETAIKFSRGRSDFQIDPQVLRTGLLGDHYVELEIRGEHALVIATLPPIHKDPFDRILIAQAMVEGITLLTSDAKIAQYSGPILRV